MIKTEKITKFDKSVDANCTLDEYISSNYGGLPNEWALEEQWNELPAAIEGKPVRTLWTGKFKIFPQDSPVRFYMNRMTDVTGVSGTGKVLSGVILPSGKVVIEWIKPYQNLGIYENIQQFLTIHVDCHPDSNEVVFID